MNLYFPVHSSLIFPLFFFEKFPILYSHLHPPSQLEMIRSKQQHAKIQHFYSILGVVYEWMNEHFSTPKDEKRQKSTNIFTFFNFSYQFCNKKNEENFLRRTQENAKIIIYCGFIKFFIFTMFLPRVQKSPPFLNTMNVI